MADNDYDDELDYDDDSINNDYDDEDTKRSGAAAGASAWFISLLVHLAALLLLGIIFVATQKIQDRPAVRMAVLEEPPQEEKKEERDLVEKPDTDIVSEVEVETPVVTELELEVEELETEEPVEEAEQAKGREEAVASSEMASSAAFMAIGASGGAAGAFGSRSGGGRKRAVGKFGGSKGSESAVEAALRWFAKHQSPNGQWDVDGYPINCKEAGPKCEAGSAHTNKKGDVAITGYAILCFLGAGYDHKTPNKWRKVVKKGIDWLVEQQNDKGSVHGDNYANGVAAMALAEAYAMTFDPKLKDPAQKIIDVVKQRQGKAEDGYGRGWSYGGPNIKRNDASVSGWNIMALKSAKAADLDVGDSMEGAKLYIEEAWKERNKKWKDLDSYGDSYFPYVWNKPEKTTKNGSKGITCVGALSAVFLGWKNGDVLLDTQVNFLAKKYTPKKWPCDTYYMYYNTLTMFQVGGDKFKMWNKQVRDMLVDAQRKDPACFDGSWDPKGAGGHGIGKVGRTLITAYCCLSLEVYYRYLPVAMQKGK